MNAGKPTAARWDGSLNEAQLRRLNPQLRERVLAERRAELEDEVIAAQSLGLRRTPFNEESIPW